MLAWILVVGIVVANVIPASDRPNMGVGHNYEHLLAFVVVGLCVYASLFVAAEGADFIWHCLRATAGTRPLLPGTLGSRIFLLTL